MTMVDIATYPLPKRTKPGYPDASISSQSLARRVGGATTASLAELVSTRLLVQDLALRFNFNAVGELVPLWATYC